MFDASTTGMYDTLRLTSSRMGSWCPAALLGAAIIGTLMLCSWDTWWVPLEKSFFSLEEGITMASYAAASYCPPDALTNWTCDRCTAERVERFVPTAIIFDDVWNLQAFVGYSPQLNSVLAVFRGTREGSRTNWIHNLMTSTTRVRYPGMPDKAMVHDGFYRSWTRSVLQQQVNDAIHAARAGQDLPVVVIGHSLGGALATLCAAQLVTEFNLTAVRLYTFGCPRVGNSVFAKALANTMLINTRVTHNR